MQQEINGARATNLKRRAAPEKCPNRPREPSKGKRRDRLRLSKIALPESPDCDRSKENTEQEVGWAIGEIERAGET